jgi:CelD/BcsL family acetyltransferase involved in cellulose biosynthesis
MFKIDINSDLDSLLADSTSWNALTRGVPFRDTAWLGPWWRNFGQQRQGYAVVARDDSGAIRGILPLYYSNQSSGRRTLSMLGDGDACSDYVSVLAAESDAIEVARCIGRHLLSSVSDSQTGWDVIDIDGVVEGDEPMLVLAQTLKQGAAAIHSQSRMSTWSRPASESWDDHLKTHGKSQRRKMRALCKSLANNDTLIQRSADSHGQVDQLLDALIQLHQHRWTDAGQQGSYADQRFRSFIGEAAIRFFELGQLYLTALERDGTVIGAELNVIGENRVLYSYSSGFDLDHSDVEPGRVLGVDTLQHLYRADLAGIDYMRGDEEYKQRFATESRQVFRLRAVAPAWYPKLRHAMWTTQFELTQFARRRTGRTPIVVVNMTPTA